MADEEKKEASFVKKAIIIGVIALVTMLVSGGVSYILTTIATEKALKKHDEMRDGVINSGEDKVEVEERTPGEILPVGEFTVNLKDESTTYLLCEVQIEVDISGKDKGKKILAEVQDASKQIIIKDRILNILSSKFKAEISSLEGKENLKKEIVEEINNNVLKDGEIQDVYIIKWVIQE